MEGRRMEGRRMEGSRGKRGGRGRGGERGRGEEGWREEEKGRLEERVEKLEGEELVPLSRDSRSSEGTGSELKNMSLAQVEEHLLGWVQGREKGVD